MDADEHAVTAPLLVSRISETTLTDVVTPNDELDISRSCLIKQEAQWLLASSVPLALSYLCQNSFNFISLLSVGKLGVNELAAASLATMIVNFIVLMPCVGLANALETFCSAAYTASSDKTRVGFHMQRGLVAVTAQLIPTCILFVWIDPLLVLLGQTDNVSELCGRFLRVWLWGSWPLVAFECLKRFVQAQGIMRANTIVMAVVMPIHIFTSYVLVWSPRVGLGFAGASLATVISSWLQFLGMCVFVAMSDARHAWGGFTWECSRNMWDFYRLAIPGAAMLACSWAAFELVTFGSSLFGPTVLAAQACIFSAMALTYQTPAAIGSATATRIGNLLGLGQPRRARYSAYVAICMGYIVGIICSILLYVNRKRWGYLYTRDHNVARVCAELMPYFSAVQTFDGMNGLVGGVMRALGKQRVGALVAFPSFWILGIPLGFYLALGPLELEVVGLWLGLAAAVVAYTGAQQWYILFCVDWRHEVKACLERLVSGCPKYSEESVVSYGSVV
ncbi:ethionine resistance protein [Coemansia sp. RSA 1822]|nr:ethionine resistance protein [Coemansia sp. RSA 638]KAJ2541773.1 ethionine resistance protein [Coemansia sp. RSA 1853]KAJ2561869.1 ethionine resistance protein [Coemansia sp. RSA 1822]